MSCQPSAERLTLSLRERQVLELVALGMQIKEVAGVMGLTPSTIKNYRLRLGRKLGKGPTTRVVRQAQVLGLLDAPKPEWPGEVLR